MDVTRITFSRNFRPDSRGDDNGMNFMRVAARDPNHGDALGSML
jgi:hypothetical protein